LRIVEIIEKLVYGEQYLITQGPQPTSFIASPSHHPLTPYFRVAISLAQDASSDGPLLFKGTTQCGYNMSVTSPSACCNSSPFELGTSDGGWQRASSALVTGEGRSLVVIFEVTPKQGTITNMRYAYEDYAQCMLYNAAGLPMTVFDQQVHQQS
jgi:hypothetical protein